MSREFWLLFFCPLKRQTCFKRANFVSSCKKERLAKAVCHSPQHVLCDTLNQSESIWWISTSRDQSSNKLIIFLKSALDSRSLVTLGQNLKSCDIWFSKVARFENRVTRIGMRGTVNLLLSSTVLLADTMHWSWCSHEMHQK